MEDLSSDQTIELLEKSLNRQGRFTIQDAIAITGVEINEAKRSLDKLMQKYVCKLQVSDKGDIVYDFGRSPLRRGEKTFKELFDGFIDKAYKVFKIIFKVWITVTLVVYFILFLVLLIAAIVAMVAGSKNSSSKSSNGAGNLIALIGRIFLELFFWRGVTNQTRYVTDNKGYPYKEYKNIPPATEKYRNDKKPGKKFISSVFDFVFGPPRFELNPLANHLEVATYLRENKGFVSLSELKALAGWESEHAGKFFSDCIVRFNGESKVSDNGIFYGDFEEFLRSASDVKGEKVVWYWDEYEPEYKLTGNTGGRNALVIFLNLFNLTFSLLYLNGFFADLGIAVGFDVLLGWVPLAFSALFFIIPIIRAIRISSLRHKRTIENIRKRLIKALYLNKGNEISINKLTETVNAKEQGEEELSKSTIEKTMQDLIYDWACESEVNEQAEMVYKFPNLKAEIEEMERLRADRKADKSIGNIVFDSGQMN